jgi:cellulose synthase/poly-beta-1,6-N-acetylglucosamine synthase-like glycosyltransferase
VSDELPPPTPDGHDPVAEAVREWRRIHDARSGLKERHPDDSAHRTMTLPQWGAVALIVGVLLGLVILDPVTGFTTILLIVTLAYTSMLAFRLYLVARSTAFGHGMAISDAEALAVPDELLPPYTVLVPAFKEPEVMPHLVAGLQALDYPAERLQVLLVLEADDTETIAAAHAAITTSNVRIVEVPPSEPRTKPKALNYALRESTGQLLTIYDAEDEPDPLQLRKAALALHRGGPQLACVQAQLTYFNPDQNIITRWFTIEYETWFAQFLPGLVALHTPVPLGGTSNHFRRNVLDEVGGWDPYNVTEDADLGIRLHRHGYRVGVIDSKTYEEANSDFVNWVKQRSRWYKGYFQTWLLNLRHPLRELRTMGLKPFVLCNLFIGGTPMLALLNPLFWFLTLLWFSLKPAFIASLFTGPTFYLGLFCWAIGNFLLLYGYLVTAHRLDRPKFVRSALLIPVYWAMMSLAAIKAFVQLIARPNYWEKTTHGLTRRQPAAEPTPTT